MIETFVRAGRWRNRSIADYAAALVQRSPDHTVVTEAGRSFSAAQLFGNAQALARAFIELGLTPGEVVSFQLPNWPEAMQVNIGAALAGLVVNPIVPIYRDAEVSYILRDARSRLLFLPREFRGFDHLAMLCRIHADLPDLDHLVLVRGDDPSGAAQSFDALLAIGQRSSAPLPVVDANAVKFVMYTSGTTGQPKGVLHSHNTIAAELHAVIDYWRVTDQDVVLMPSPVTHVTGYLYGLELPWLAGIAAVFMERWLVGEAIQLIDDHRVSLTVGATPFLQELAAEAALRGNGLSSLRLFACGGAPVPPEVIFNAHKSLERCVACRVYGSTEAPTVSLGVVSRADEVIGATTDGRIVGHEVRIVDPASGAPLPIGEEGEITTRGAEMMLGYADAEHTRDAFDAGGYFHTGDLGRIVAGDCIIVTGRKKDLIIRGGENLSPKEIEDVLHQHPAIREAAVVAMPHPRLGETACAFIVLNAGAKLDKEAVARHVIAAGLARQKCPEHVELVEDLPRTPSGKVRKNALREQIAARFPNGPPGD
jgi:acyl-CoA synthetase (AMP-forming)/AMP-acid ligase II